ncbi:MAG: hypothetical protein H6658_04565 [Ardenticatenaceae bacterium]|nr:hypothetical protein [Ardenticatenaceae bacterium]
MMSPKKHKATADKPVLLSAIRTILALIVPLVGAFFFAFAAEGFSATAANDQAALVPFFMGLGLVSLFLGLRWYGLSPLGMRGGRPLFSSIGFAVLGWVALIIIRFATISILGYDSGFDEFFYRLLFEAFCVQIWAFGLLFSSLAAWRGPLTAAFGSGISFGFIAILFFREAPDVPAITGLIYFLLWGIFYGIIRLRSGSLMGASLIQAFQSFTAWVVLTPNLAAANNNFSTLYIATGLAYLIFIWRLWPKQEEDYRV